MYLLSRITVGLARLAVDKGIIRKPGEKLSLSLFIGPNLFSSLIFSFTFVSFFFDDLFCFFR